MRLAEHFAGDALDREPVKRVAQSPDYPVQLMIGVFDFPGRADRSTSEIPVPALVVSRVIGDEW